MNQRTPNRHGKGTPDGGRFASEEQPARVADTRALTLDASTDGRYGEHCDGDSDPVADLYNKMIYDEAGYDAQGYNREGFNRDGYDDDGYDRNGYNVVGITRWKVSAVPTGDHGR